MTSKWNKRAKRKKMGHGVGWMGREMGVRDLWWVRGERMEQRDCGLLESGVFNVHVIEL